MTAAALNWLARLHALYWGARADAAVSSGLQKQGCYWYLNTRFEEHERMPNKGWEGRLRLAARALDARLKADPAAIDRPRRRKGGQHDYHEGRLDWLCRLSILRQGVRRQGSRLLLVLRLGYARGGGLLLKGYHQDLSQLLIAQGDTPPELNKLEDALELAYADLGRWMSGWGWWGHAGMLRERILKLLDKLDGGSALKGGEAEYKGRGDARVSVMTMHNFDEPHNRIKQPRSPPETERRDRVAHAQSVHSTNAHLLRLAPLLLRAARMGVHTISFSRRAALSLRPSNARQYQVTDESRALLLLATDYLLAATLLSGVLCNFLYYSLMAGFLTADRSELCLLRAISSLVAAAGAVYLVALLPRPVLVASTAVYLGVSLNFSCWWAAIWLQLQTKGVGAVLPADLAHALRNERPIDWLRRKSPDLSFFSKLRQVVTLLLLPEEDLDRALALLPPSRASAYSAAGSSTLCPRRSAASARRGQGARLPTRAPRRAAEWSQQWSRQQQQSSCRRRQTGGIHSPRAGDRRAACLCSRVALTALCASPTDDTRVPWRSRDQLPRHTARQPGARRRSGRILCRQRCDQQRRRQRGGAGGARWKPPTTTHRPREAAHAVGRAGCAGRCWLSADHGTTAEVASEGVEFGSFMELENRKCSERRDRQTFSATAVGDRMRGLTSPLSRTAFLKLGTAFAAVTTISPMAAQAQETEYKRVNPIQFIAAARRQDCIIGHWRG